MWIDSGFPAKRVLRIAQVHRSTYYYRLSHPPIQKTNTGGRPIPGFSRNRQGKKIKDETIKEYLLELISSKAEVYGYRKLTRCLQRQYKLIINKKKVYRLCKELDILMPQREKKQKYPRRLAKNHVITGSNQLWQLDIKYGYVSSSRRFFYVASAIDVHDRTIVGHYRGTTCEAKDVTNMLQKALLKRGIYELEEDQSLIIRTDNGPQFISNKFEEFCLAPQVQHERIPPKSPNMNAYIESFHSVLERECFQRNEFITFDQAFKCVDEYIQFYNEERYHGSLDDYSPTEYYNKWLAGEIKSVKQSM
ncbi:IS3 family transposase [Neobacillus sp. D3-1R]|uniref:IS3 family transposase n=1 Tax=Neobacillus sp. D3-1R TaxID=3445778 RepID=UPI003F9F9402